MKTINTEELVIASLLLLGEAIGFVTTHLLVPGISLILAGLGWRPPTRPEVEPLELLELLEPGTPFFPWPVDDLADDYSREVPTAEERSPSLRRRGKR
jgi:hypothetical protein